MDEGLRQLIAERTGRDPDELEVRVFVGAVLGAVTAAWASGRGDIQRFLDDLDRAAALLKASLPL